MQGVRNVTFRGRMPRERVPEVIANADVTIMSLRDLPLFEDALPTKLLEYMAAGKPVVAAAAGQVARLVQQVQCGIVCRPEDSGGIVAAIRRLAADPSEAYEMGLRGRRYVEAHLSRETFVERLEGVVDHVVAADHLASG